MLDVGRSVYARLGHASPTELWQPAPELYADLAWPPGSDVPEAAARGRQLYVRWCATCHGPDGRGNGPAAPSLIPRPRDFTRGLFKYKTAPAAQPPTDDDLARAIRGGIAKGGRPLHWQAMIWDHASNSDEEDVRALIAFLRVMPPVRRAIPATRPPASDDCEVYTFWVEASSAPGCR